MNASRTYTAIFEIDSGVSQGFGIVYSEKYEERENITASNDEEAMLLTAKRAAYWARESLSNPNTCRTDVKITSLLEGNRTINQKTTTSLVKKLDFLRFENNCALLSLTREEKLLIRVFETQRKQTAYIKGR
ncbi:MAG: hypothetical protein AABX65_01685 [Nanoarchaeota archaeon]